MKAENRLGSVFCVIAAVAVATVVSGCSRNMSDLDKYVAEVKSRKSGHIEPIPEMKPFESYTYPTNANLRNPFQPLGFGQEAASAPEQEQNADAGPKPDPTRAKEALEEYPLDSLSYVGTLTQNHSTWALVRDPDGTIHRVSTGNYLGQNYGRIVAITPQGIKLRELVQKPNGGWLERKNSIALRDGQS